MQSSTPGYPLWSSSIVARLVGLRRSLVRSYDGLLRSFAKEASPFPLSKKEASHVSCSTDCRPELSLRRIEELVARTELVHFDPAVPLLNKERAKTLSSLWVLAACTASDPLAAYEAFIAPQHNAKLELPEHAFKDFCARIRNVRRRISGTRFGMVQTQVTAQGWLRASAD